VSIFPLPIFERDADPAHRDALTDAEAYARLKPPSSIVVKFGSMRLIGEYPYDGDAKPGCGSKIVTKTHRGTELAEMLTTTCPNSGCSKSVSRREMLEYVDNSGGKDYPFHTNGRVLRVATVEDMNAWSALRDRFAREELAAVREEARSMGFTMKIVEVEPVLGGEHVTVHYLSEERVDFRELVPALARRFGARVEMHQIGARDEARLTADYEKCGQHCCCKNFLKVLKPVSMRSAKVQKASLDPLKISGRCGRLMCCLRYEDETYDELRKRLPHRKTRVGTSEGPGIVVDSKILVQLVLVKLEHDGREIAVPVEELLPPDACPAPTTPPDPFRGMRREDVARRAGSQGRAADGRAAKDDQQQKFAKDAAASGAAGTSGTAGAAGTPGAAPSSGKKKRRRRGRGRGKGPANGPGGSPGSGGAPGNGDAPSGDAPPPTA
jgi:cell fate regulator YaaT (PSP1 superfamily)